MTNVPLDMSCHVFEALYFSEAIPTLSLCQLMHLETNYSVEQEKYFPFCPSNFFPNFQQEIQLKNFPVVSLLVLWRFFLYRASICRYYSYFSLFPSPYWCKPLYSCGVFCPQQGPLSTFQRNISLIWFKSTKQELRKLWMFLDSVWCSSDDLLQEASSWSIVQLKLDWGPGQGHSCLLNFSGVVLWCFCFDFLFVLIEIFQWNALTDQLLCVLEIIYIQIN